MSDFPQHNPAQTLSEISHLFLSGVRDRASNGSPRPTRIPPPRQDVSIDMTSAEFAQAFSAAPAESLAASPADLSPADIEPAAHPDLPPQRESAQKPVSALIVGHLGENAVDSAKAYARHLAATHSQRIGILELDAALFRLYSVERSLASEEPSPEEPAQFELHQLAEALDEMNWDIDRWLVLLPAPRLPEARSLLRNCGHWVLLCPGDHDSMVAAYRTLKGLNDGHRPRLSLAVLDSEAAEADRIHKKLASVCTQFLSWPVADFASAADSDDAEAHLVLAWRPVHDKAQAAANPHWKIAADFLRSNAAHVIDDTPALSDAEAAFVSAAEVAPAPNAPTPATAAPTTVVPVAAAPQPVAAPQPAPAPAAQVESPVEEKAVLHTIMPSIPMPAAVSSDVPEVLDLASSDSGSILAAVLQHRPGELVECPLRPPMCPDARLALTRDRRLVLLAVARQGLADLRSISLAYRWLLENRPLISMALPQLSLDAHQLPALRLLVNHVDLSADLLQPLLASSSVTVSSYRTLRWGQKTGLLLEAA